MASSPIVLDIGSSDDELGFPFDSSLPFPGDFSLDVDDDVVIIDELPPVITKRDRNSSDHRKRSDSSSPKTNGVSHNRKVDDDDDDCLVLDEDPNGPHPVSEKNWGDGSDDLVVVSEKGPVACRDFPHSRHMCVSFPFKETAHEKYCQMCHCYVCDVPAPCTHWGNGGSPDDHCHSHDSEPKWKFLRKNLRGVPKTLPEFAKLNGTLPQKASRCNSSSLFPVVQYTNYRSVTIQSSSHFSDVEPRARCNFNPPVPSIMRRKRPMQFQSSNDEMRFSHPHPKLQKVATPLDVLASTAASARQNFRTGNPRYRCRRSDPPRNFPSITPADILQRVEDFLMDDSNHFASHRTARNADYIQSFENTYSAAFPPSSKNGASFALPPPFSPPPDFESVALKGLDVPPGFEAPPGFAFNSSNQFSEATVTFERNDHNYDYLYESLPFTPQPASPNFPLADYLGPSVLDSDPSCIVTDETRVCIEPPRLDEPPPQGFTSCSDSFVAPPPIVPQHSESQVSTQFSPPGQQIDASENEHGLQRLWNELTVLPCPVEEDSYQLP